MQNSQELSHYLKVPIIADSVDAPIVQYGGELGGIHYRGEVSAIHFITDDRRWGRVTFEKLDSLKISRGEYHPYSCADESFDRYSWVTTVSNSAWLLERYMYEKRYYGDSYFFNGNVEEMLEEFSHFVFSFHDQFVEVLAAGIWFECDDTMVKENSQLSSKHPLRGLAHLEASERFDYSGIVCHIRRNPLSNYELDRNAQMCSQTILEFYTEFSKGEYPSWSLTYRIQNGIGKSYLRNSFGNSVQTYDGIPSLLTIQPQINQWLSVVSKRRSETGKT
jgi:hypothetical protein